MVSCTEFIPFYSELFKYLEDKNGKEEVIRYWEFISDTFVKELLGEKVKKLGLKGCYEYWSKSLNEEACGFKMVLDEENNEFSIDLFSCPSRGMLNSLAYMKPYNDYCGHCAVLYSRVLKEYGIVPEEMDFSKVDKARCYLRYKGISAKVYNDISLLQKEKRYLDVYKFLSENDLAKLETGRHEISENCFVNVIEYNTKKEVDNDYEAHRIYDDIQYIISGEEKIKWHHLSNMEKTSEYNLECDYQFFDGDNGKDFLLKSGEFVVFTPNDAHKPQFCVEKEIKIKKAVFKVKR